MSTYGEGRWPGSPGGATNDVRWGDAAPVASWDNPSGWGPPTGDPRRTSSDGGWNAAPEILRDDDASPMVRPFMITKGRTRSAGGEDLPLETLVVTSAAGVDALNASRLTWERREIAALCSQGPVSVAEVSALLRVPLGVARVLVSDMNQDGFVDVYRPRQGDDRPDVRLLERVLDAIDKL